MERWKTLRKRVLAGATGVAAGIGLLLAGLFGTADELLTGAPEEETGEAPGAHVQTQSQIPSEIGQLPLESPLSRQDRARRWIWNLPAALRACVLLPLYGVGRLLMLLLAPLLSALSPLTAAVAGFALRGLLLFALFALLYKLLFPHAKLRTLFQKGRWLWLLLGALLLTVADRLLLRYVPDYAWIRLCIGLVLGFALLLLLWNRFFRDHAAPEPPEKWVDLPDAA